VSDSCKSSAQTARSIGSKAKMITPETPLPQAAINTALLSLGLSRELSIMELSKAMAFCLLFHAN
jgi:hypothetical protein